MPTPLFRFRYPVISSRNNLKRVGLKTPPCSTPYAFSNNLPIFPPHLTLDRSFWNMLFKVCRNFPCTPFEYNLNNRADVFTKSKADLKLTNQAYKGRPFNLHFWKIPFSMNILSSALVFALNPFWNGSSISRHSFAYCRRLFNIPSQKKFKLLRSSYLAVT